MDKRISELFDYGDEIVLGGEADRFDPAEIREMTMKKLHTGRGGRRLKNTGRTLLIAAVLMSLLTVTALAAGLTIHQRRQEEIKDRLGIEENHVSGFADMETPAEAGEGITVLSVFNTGSTTWVYFNVSPVEPNEVRDSMITDQDGDRVHSLLWMVSPDNEGWGDASILTADWDFDSEDLLYEHGSPGDEDYWFSPSQEAVQRKYLEQGYDAETKTLTLKYGIPNENLDLSGPVRLHLVCADYTALLEPCPEAGEGVSRAAEEDIEPRRDYGWFSFTPVREVSSRVVWFEEPVKFENEELGGAGRFVGVEFSASGLYWIIDCETLTDIFTPPHDFATEAEREEYRRFEASWLNLTDSLEREASITFADGSSVAGLNGETGHIGDDGYLYARGHYGGRTTVDVEQIISVTICGVTVPLR